MTQQKLTKEQIEYIQMEMQMVERIVDILDKAKWEDRRKFEGSLSVLANLIINIINAAERSYIVDESDIKKILEELFDGVVSILQAYRENNQPTLQ